MINAAFIVRSTLHSVPGGDTVQVLQTAKWLKLLDVNVEIILTHEQVDYEKYQLFHFFNLGRPADIIAHLPHIRVPVFVSPIMVDYSEFDKYYRQGLAGIIFKNLSPATNEYVKTISRWVKGTDKLVSSRYIWIGQNKSIKKVLRSCTALLPNSRLEMDKIQKLYHLQKLNAVIPNGIDHTIFVADEESVKDQKLVICVARIEGIKNQLNLIKALNNTEYTLMLIGSPAPNQLPYYSACKDIAASNIMFKERMSQESLVSYYNKARVHVLPSWFETCGLSSLEAAAMGCNIVVTDKGFTSEYFGDDAEYCEPADPTSIKAAVDRASAKPVNKNLQKLVKSKYTWEQAASKTKEVYDLFAN